MSIIKKTTFQKIIDSAMEKGAVVTEIMRSVCHWEYAVPGDIIRIELTYRGVAYLIFVDHYFGNGTIDVAHAKYGKSIYSKSEKPVG